ncbi:hypothetical protein [Companilactobacillus formosensis]|uniref:hypothetical protein n=1 Tax=Companilactobacillus formosensis TaxID=1617889 RepID=UPI000E657B44|nr:hypothetical protein [Companilactobacillus formosensis]
MDTKQLLKLLLESLYKYPILQQTLSNNSENNKKSLASLKPLSYAFNKIKALSAKTLIFALVVYAWSLLVLISIGLFSLRISPYFSFYLILFSSLLFLLIWIVQTLLYGIMFILERRILKDFKVYKTEEYISNYISDGEKHFNILNKKEYKDIPENLLNLIKMDDRILSSDFQSKGLITEIVNVNSNNIIYLQFEPK